MDAFNSPNGSVSAVSSATTSSNSPTQFNTGRATTSPGTGTSAFSGSNDANYQASQQPVASVPAACLACVCLQLYVHVSLRDASHVRGSIEC